MITNKGVKLAKKLKCHCCGEEFNWKDDICFKLIVYNPKEDKDFIFYFCGTTCITGYLESIQSAERDKFYDILFKPFY